MVDLSKIKVGDRVDVRGFVTEINLHRKKPSGAFTVAFKQPHGAYTELNDVEVIPESVISHIPAPPKPPVVGDRVRNRLVGCDAVIRAIIEDDAWVLYGDGSQGVASLDQLERVQ